MDTVFASSFHNPAFFSKASAAPAPSYSAKPASPEPPQASQNCTIVEKTNPATVCVPKLGEPVCSPVTLKGVEVGEGEKCLSITRTVCTEGVEEVKATFVEITFNEECSSQMVTVCE